MKAGVSYCHYLNLARRLFIVKAARQNELQLNTDGEAKGSPRPRPDPLTGHRVGRPAPGRSHVSDQIWIRVTAAGQAPAEGTQQLRPPGGCMTSADRRHLVFCESRPGGWGGLAGHRMLHGAGGESVGLFTFLCLASETLLLSPYWLRPLIKEPLQ